MLSQQPALLYNIASALRGLRRPHEAAEALRSYLRLQPEDPDAPAIAKRIQSLEEEQRLLDAEPGGTSSVVFGGGGGSTVWAELSEWSGPTALDATGIKTAVQAALTMATTSTPANGSVGISVFGEATAAQSVVFTPGTWQNLDDNGGAANGWHVTSDYLLAPPLGQPLSADAATNFSGAWYGAVATFR
jgi:hypothetical protein